MDDALPAASSSTRRWSRLDVTWLAIVVAIVPIVVNLARDLIDGTIPVGDAAYFTVRSLDVATTHHPLVGAWSSGSVALTEPINNLGPLQLDLLAPFTKMAPLAGTLVGTAVINIASLIGIGLGARRIGGPRLAVATLATFSLVTWTMGSVLLVDARQQHTLMLPFSCVLVLCWGVTAGARVLAPFAVLAGSVVVQTHLSYLFPVIAVAGATTAVAVVSWWRDRDDGTAASARRGWRRVVSPLPASLAVMAVCWIQPVIDQLWGRGNMLNLVTAADDSRPGPGPVRGLRLMATVLTDPGTWGRGGFGRFDPAFRLASPTRTIVGLAALVLLVAGMTVLAWHRRDRTGLAALGVVVAGSIGGAVAGARLPRTAFGIVAANYRWLWPLVAMLIVAVFVVVGEPLARRLRALPAGVAVTWVVLGAFAVAGLARSNQLWLPVDRRREDVTAELLRQLRAAPLDGSVVVDRRGEQFASPYAYPVMVALQERGIEFRFDSTDRVDIARFGDGRDANGASLPRLVIFSPAPPRDGAEGELVAGVGTLTQAELDRLGELSTRFVDELRAGEFEVGDLPAGFLERRFPAVASLATGVQPERDVLLFELVEMLRADVITLPGVPSDEVDAWLRLKDLVADSVALYLQPPTG